MNSYGIGSGFGAGFWIGTISGSQAGKYGEIHLGTKRGWKWGDGFAGSPTGRLYEFDTLPRGEPPKKCVNCQPMMRSALPGTIAPNSSTGRAWPARQPVRLQSGLDEVQIWEGLAYGGHIRQSRQPPGVTIDRPSSRNFASKYEKTMRVNMNGIGLSRNMPRRDNCGIGGRRKGRGNGIIVAGPRTGGSV